MVAGELLNTTSCRVFFRLLITNGEPILTTGSNFRCSDYVNSATVYPKRQQTESFEYPPIIAEPLRPHKVSRTSKAFI